MGTRKLGRTTSHRMSMLNGMVAYLIENGKIETTLTRAKEVRVLTDKMITLGKKGGLANYRRALASLNNNKAVVAKLFDTIAPRYATVNGGYTAVYKLGPRRGDGAEMALITLTGMTAVATEKEDKAVKAAPKATKAAAKAKVEEAKEEAIVEEKAEDVAEEKAEEPKKATATKKASTAKTTAAKKTTGTKTTTKTTAAKTTKSTTAKTTKTTTTRKTAKAAEDKAE